MWLSGYHSWIGKTRLLTDMPQGRKHLKFSLRKTEKTDRRTVEKWKFRMLNESIDGLKRETRSWFTKTEMCAVPLQSSSKPKYLEITHTTNFKTKLVERNNMRHSCLRKGDLPPGSTFCWASADQFLGSHQEGIGKFMCWPAILSS